MINLMNMKIIAAFTILFFTFATQSSNAQTPSKYGATPEDSVNCLNKLSEYNEFFKQKDYQAAIPGWRWVFINCPKSSKKMFSNGEKMYKSFIRKQKDTEKKDKLIDTLLSIYDKRIENFGQEGFVLGKKGVDMMQYRSNSYEEAYTILTTSVGKQGKKSKGSALTAYFQSAVLMLENEKIEKTKLIEIFENINIVIEYHLAKITDEKKRKFYATAKENTAKLFEPIASCEDLIEMYTTRFDENAENADWLKRGTAMLDKKECTEDPLFVKMAETLHNLEPSSESAYNIGKMLMKKGQNEKALTFYKQAVELQADTMKKADYLLTLSNHCFKNLKQFDVARLYARKAASLKSNWGAPYILIGDMYAASAKSCGTNDFESSAVYWSAVDKYIRAKSIDGSIAEEANKKIATWSKYFPNQKDAFFYGFNDGQPYSIACWINETTKVRVQQQ